MVKALLKKHIFLLFTTLILTLIQCRSRELTSQSGISSTDLTLIDLYALDWIEVHRLALLSRLSYSDPEEITGELEDLKKEAGVVDYKFINEKGTQVYLFDFGSSLTFVFRGTEENWQDYSTDMNFWHRSINGLRGHAGFFNAYKWVAEHIDNYLATLPVSSRRNHQTKSITLAGHSLGGALAQIAAHELSDKINLKHVVTFGAPRVFNALSSQKYDKKLKVKTYNIIYNQDFVSGLPHWSLNFKRTGNAVYIVGGNCGLSTKPIPIKGIIKRKFENDIEFLKGLKLFKKPIKPLIDVPLPLKDHALQNYIDCTAVHAGVEEYDK